VLKIGLAQIGLYVQIISNQESALMKMSAIITLESHQKVNSASLLVSLIGNARHGSLKNVLNQAIKPDHVQILIPAIKTLLN